MAKSKTLQKIRRATACNAIRLLILITQVVPRSVAIAIGSWIGQLIYLCAGNVRYRFEQNFQEVTGSYFSEIRKREITRKYFIVTSENLIDVFRLPQHFHSELRQLVQLEGYEHWASACARGKGVLGVTGHIGNFELLAAYMNTLDRPVAVVGRELYDRGINKILIRNRHAMGLVNIATTDSPKRILAWLRQGNALGVLIDTDSNRVRSMMVPAFGRLSNTPVGQSIIAIKTGAAVCPSACVRLPDHSYKIIIKPAIEIEPTGNLERDAWQLTLECTRALDQIILSYPEQWIWQHNRWRTPATEPVSFKKELVSEHAY